MAIIFSCDAVPLKSHTYTHTHVSSSYSVFICLVSGLFSAFSPCLCAFVMLVCYLRTSLEIGGEELLRNEKFYVE